MGWYERELVGTGRAGAFWTLLGFLVTFAIVRGITRRIRAKGANVSAAPADQPDAEDTSTPAKRSGLGDIYIGGVHVHHQLWGILLVLVCGLLEFRYSPQSPWLEVLAVLFGAGAALILDEFALLFYMSDVYWGQDGRKSIDAIMIGAALALLLLTQASPFGTEDGVTSGWEYLAVVVVHVVTAVICLAKGKLATGVIGIVVPFVALVGAVRLAKPESPWARRRYSERPRKAARAEHRFDADYERRHNRISDFLGGRPDPAARSGTVDEST